MTTLQTPGVHPFAARLLDDLLARAPGENIFISPLSIFMALAAVANGAAGETFRAIASALGAPATTADDLNAASQHLQAQLERLDPERYRERQWGSTEELRVRAEIANGLWLSHARPFVPAFVDTLRETYRAEVAGADFGAPETAEIIDRWVSERTAGVIKQIAGELDAATTMMLVNAITFKGGWDSVFKPEETTEELFTPPDGAQIPCDMMHQQQHYFYAESEVFQLVALPFIGSKVTARTEGAAMLVVLPRPGCTPADALASLGPNWHYAATHALPQGRPEIALGLPRFSLAFDACLNDSLAAMGMGVALEAERADFSGMTPVRPTAISEVRHSTALIVNEYGAEAAGATAVKMVTFSLPSVIEMRVDRPFLCAIVAGQEWTPLFVGVVNRPERVSAAEG